ncbi:hypothetical protein RRG08_061173 [Elysia crispata]|uniref:Vacuolar protein sorting-associated protein 13A n=1 Tax=Elysia crispata TaxID=231223 RepID=A0AAE1CEC1_9GAST|nr:hypothetical protein RRG08_061173 [Elysia crispata]
MVFESIVVELINRYLGTFVENLDTSQLKIGIWGGDVVLNNLNLQESALDDLDLPVKIKAGHISKLTLKIPWKNLYSEPVLAHIDGIYALAVPNIAIKYDGEKEEKTEQEAKQARLAKIEEQKKLEAEKDKPADPKQASFAEKLATQVIKNLQVRVANIHVRYEDKYTNPARPFAIGVTLQELLFQTTDSNWKETVIKEAVTQIYKLVRLDSLSVYWNSYATLFQDQAKTEILKNLSNNVPKQGKKTNLQYLFKPISAVAHLRLNTKPELTDFSLPKIFLTLVFDEIAVSLAKCQYDDVLEMLESLERMNLLAKFKKTRPEVDFSDTKAWWKHAYAATLEHTVQRRRKMWRWSNIKRHRDLLKQYRAVYARKLDVGDKKLSSADNALIKSCEQQLDVFNICLCRNQAEMDAKKLGKKREEEKESSGGWLGGWFGGGKQKKQKEENDSDASALGSKFQEEFNSDEKAKLYKAIGYDENAKDPTFPIEFVAVRLVTKLNKLSVALVDSKLQDSQLLRLSLTEICASFGQRPAADAIRLDAKVERLRVNGVPRGDYMPKLVSSVGVSKEESTSLLMVAVETNPQDGLCDSRIRVQSRPLEIIYDAITVNNLASFFKPPESVRLKQLSTMAMARYDVIKAQTTAGMVHMMEDRKYADIEVNLMPSYVIVPATGELRNDVCLLLLNLGSFNINSEKTAALTPGAQYSQQELENYSYDKFNMSLDNLQLLYIQPGDTWQDENRLSTSPLYLLRPVSLHLLLEKCVFSNDPKLPQIRISGELPIVSVTISDNKLMGVMKLVNSIPLPETGDVRESKDEETVDDAVGGSEARLTLDDMLTFPSANPEENSFVSELTNFTKVSLSFIIKEVSAELRETKDNVELPFLRLSIHGIGVDLKARTFDLALEAFIGGIYLQHLQYKVAEGIRAQLAKCNVITGELINIINSPDVKEGERLLSVSFLQADTKGPEFKTAYNSTAQAISIEFTTLELVLHQGVVLSLLEFAQKLQPPEAASKQTPSSPNVARRKSSVASGSTLALQKTRKKTETELYQMRLKALVDGVQLSLCNEETVIMHTRVAGIEVGVGMQESKLRVEAIMRQIELLDTDLNTYYPEIVSVYGEEMFKFEMMQYNQGTVGQKFDNVNNCDMDIKLNMGRARIVFVNKFVKSLTNFLDNFAVAKSRLDKAGQALKEAGKDVTKSLQEQAPRVKLTIQIKAPLIVVPRSSKSEEAVVLHLGDIVVLSKHELVPGSGEHPPGKANIVEKLMAELTNVQISRAKLGRVETVVSEITIIEPMTFKVNVSRNLSTAWFHGIPDIEVTGVFDSIFIRINQEDVKLFALLAEDNLGEPDPVNPHYKPETRESKPEVVVESTRSSSLEFHTTLSPVSEQAEEKFSNLKVDFKLISVSIELYQGLNPLDKGVVKRNPDKMLSALKVHALEVDLNMMSDSSMQANVSLQDFTLDDCRTEKQGGITRMISQAAFNKEDANAGASTVETTTLSQRLIYLTFDQNSKQDKVLVVNISSIHACVCLEFLVKVADFFTKAMPSTQQKTIAAATQAQTEHDKKTAKLEAKPRAPEASETDKGSLDFTLKLGKPEIFLIEDQMNTHTDSLIVDVEVDFRMRMNPNALSINGNIRQLSLVSCVFGKADTKKVVLSPVDIMVIGNGPMGKDQHIDVSMTDFIMTVSPATIRLLSAVAAAASIPSDDESVMHELEDFSTIWKKQSLADVSFWFTNSVIDMGTSLDEASTATSLNMEDEQQRGEQVKSRSSRRLNVIYSSKDVVLRLQKVGKDLSVAFKKPLKRLMLSAPNLVIKLEGGIGHRTVPLLIVESSFSAEIRNWSSELYVESSLGLEIAYNNESIGVWEPLLEPVLDTKGEYHKWSIGLEVIKAEDSDLHEEDTNILPPPKLTVNVTAIDALQILMTKTCLDVLNNLGAAFSAAYQLQDMEGTLGQKIVPFIFKNRTGKDMAFFLDSSFLPSIDHGKPDLNNVHTDEDIYMDVKVAKESSTYTSVIRSTQNQKGKNIKFQMLGEASKFDLSIQQAKKMIFSLPKYQVVATIEALIGQKIVTFTSCVMVTNHLEIPVEVLYHDTSGMIKCGVVYPDHPFPVPLAAVYCSTGEIFFQPKTDQDDYSTSKECIKWKTINEAKKVKQFTCEARAQGKPSYYFNVMPLFENIHHDAKSGKTGKGEKMVNLHLHPTVILHNLLPLEVTYTIETHPREDDDVGRYTYYLWDQPEEIKLASSLNVPLPHAAVNLSELHLKIPQYRDLTWTAKKFIKLDVPELSVLTFQADDRGKPLFMDLGLHCKQRDGSFDLSVYSPYWIVNLSDKDLAFKEDDKEAPLIHKKDNKNIMLFFYRDKPLFGSGTKRKVMLRVGDAEWSDKFSLDTVGSSGNVTCKVKGSGGIMEVGLSITLAASGLTKVATFSPFFLLQNAATVPICVREDVPSSEWVIVEVSECKPFYPETSDKEMKIVAKVKDASDETVPFFLNKAHTTLLKLDDKYGGINADCRVSESQMITTFKTYKPGMATVQFVNHLQDSSIKIKQTGSTAEPFTLEPQTSQLYTWDNPTGKREVTWSSGKKEFKSALEQDQLEEFFAANEQKAYLVSFLDGMQRVVMFTEDLALATVAQEAGELEQADQEINLKIHDMGFSLINNQKMLELTYMGITSSGVIWEEKKKRLKAMKLKDMTVLEHAYQKYLMESSTGKAKPVAMLENKLEVDFEKMELLKPRHCAIRRSFSDGIWVQMRTSPHSRQFHAKINRLQFDNQLRQAVFPTILAPIPPPKSVAADSVPKPFVEVSLMTRIHEHSDLIQVKYFKVLVQEMNLQVDQGILNELLGLFASDANTQREQEVVAFKADVEATKRDLKEQAGVSMKAKSVTFYDYFHVSPIKIHLSFSLQGMGSSESTQSMIFGVFLQSVGVVLTDVQDVLFKLGYFERNHSFYNNSQLTSELIRHYSGQAMKQMYVLVLGLDVIGNPFGLVRGFSEGIEDLFYEPYQGAIQGPEEFAEGLALGVRSLFGHAVGGAAGAVSRITGTLGKGLAALTLDDDYQKKRREQLNKKPATAREGFARGGKGLVMGVFDGVTGIVRKPVEGAKQEGVSGFFKGMGKGLVGVVTRPTSGVVDFASSSLEGIRRITDFSEEVHRLRPPRTFKKDGVVRPYIRAEAEGYNLLYETDKGQYSESDEYVTHINIKGDGKTVFIVTDKRLMLAKRGELFGAWDSEWVFKFEELKAEPKQIPKGIEILLKDPKKKNFFSGTVTKKEVHIANPKVASEVVAKIQGAMKSKQSEEK